MSDEPEECDDNLPEPRSISEIARELFDRADSEGWWEAMGMSPRYGNRYDPTVCKCGGGCESPLECTFWYWLRKTNRMERGANRQVEIGKFRVDCLIDCDGQKVVVELDGKQWHKNRQKEDWERDKELLKTVDAVIRIPFAAMHWYPEATFTVLGRWFPRFQLRGSDLFCLSVSQFLEELKTTPNPEGDFPTRESFIEWAEPNYELWLDAEVCGWVGSPKAWLEQWNVTPIRIYRAHERDRKEPA